MKELSKNIRYEAKSEFGVLKFRKYRRLIEWIIPYWPKWLHKIKVYKIKDGRYYYGQYTKNNRWPIKF